MLTPGTAGIVKHSVLKFIVRSMVTVVKYTDEISSVWVMGYIVLVNGDFNILQQTANKLTDPLYLTTVDQ